MRMALSLFIGLLAVGVLPFWSILLLNRPPAHQQQFCIDYFFTHKGRLVRQAFFPGVGLLVN
jgi:hypothetical protein